MTYVPLTEASRESILVEEVKAAYATRVKFARTVAICADVLQIALFPLVSEGFISPLDDALDVVVCAVLTWLIGWHYAFLPSFVLKVMPVADLIPSWTVAVLIATRSGQVPVTTEVHVEPPPIHSASEK